MEKYIFFPIAINIAFYISNNVKFVPKTEKLIYIIQDCFIFDVFSNTIHHIIGIKGQIYLLINITVDEIFHKFMNVLVFILK